MASRGVSPETTGSSPRNMSSSRAEQSEIAKSLAFSSLRLGQLKLWKEVKAKNRRSGRKMSDAIFVAKRASGHLTIGDKREIDKATWRKPFGIRLTPTSRYIRNKLVLK